MTKFDQTDWQCIQSLRGLAIDAIEQARSGHPGLPLGCAPMLYVLFKEHLKFDIDHPLHPDRTPFILSPGHGSALLYSILYALKLGIDLEDLKSFRQLHSKTPGHPERGVPAFIELTTGPLGQGGSSLVGFAISEALRAKDKQAVPQTCYALVSDGDLMEGVFHEACSLAGHLKLGHLVYLYDSNDISLDGPTSLAFSTENVAARFLAYGFSVFLVEKGDTDLDAIDKALSDAKLDPKPSIIIIKTTIGKGSPFEGTEKIHGQPLIGQDVLTTKMNLNITWEKFTIPTEAQERFLTIRQQKKLPQVTTKKSLPGNLDEWIDECPSPKESQATRTSSSILLNHIAKKYPELIGGDADLSVSTLTFIKNAGRFHESLGKNIAFGVREHAMAAIANGIAAHGFYRPYVATFFCFLDYLKPALRISALDQLPVIYIFTHDSIGLGEDGPTHQPIEHLMSLRLVPNMMMFRPADFTETKAAWKVILQHQGPAALVLSRQNLPQCTTLLGHEAMKGAYLLEEHPEASVQIIATGSEVHLAQAVAKMLSINKVYANVVSMPSWDVFKKQPLTYQNHVIKNTSLLSVSIEAGVTEGYQAWVGQGLRFGIDSFGLSGKYEDVYKAFKLDVSSIYEKIISHLK